MVDDTAPLASLSLTHVYYVRLSSDCFIFAIFLPFPFFALLVTPNLLRRVKKTNKDSDRETERQKEEHIDKRLEPKYGDKRLRINILTYSGPPRSRLPPLRLSSSSPPSPLHRLCHAYPLDTRSRNPLHVRRPDGL